MISTVMELLYVMEVILLVKTKQVIGKVANEEEKGSVLNFEVFKDTEKLNPELWLAK